MWAKIFLVVAVTKDSRWITITGTMAEEGKPQEGAFNTISKIATLETTVLLLACHFGKKLRFRVGSPFAITGQFLLSLTILFVVNNLLVLSLRFSSDNIDEVMRQITRGFF